MLRYIALLRGINVSGHRMIKMSELREMLQSVGTESVQTYIQSGNVVFESTEQPEPLRQRIERQILEVFGFEVPVVLRTVEQMAHIAEACPFPVDTLAEGERLFVSFIADTPASAAIDGLSLTKGNGIDEFRVVQNEIYILYRQSVHQSSLSNAYFERKLGVAATSRNWRTVTKLVEMGKKLG